MSPVGVVRLCGCMSVLCVGGVGNLTSVFIVVASEWVWLDSVGVVCVSVSFGVRELAIGRGSGFRWYN